MNYNKNAKKRNKIGDITLKGITKHITATACKHGKESLTKDLRTDTTAQTGGLTISERSGSLERTCSTWGATLAS